MWNLFQHGNFVLHSGDKSSFKIDCDALTDEDIDACAYEIAVRVGDFSSVLGIPNGGLRLAKALEKYCVDDGPLLIVDDVMTTSKSMQEAKISSGREDVIGAVIFCRDLRPSWIMPLFWMWPV